MRSETADHGLSKLSTQQLVFSFVRQTASYRNFPIRHQRTAATGARLIGLFGSPTFSSCRKRIHRRRCLCKTAAATTDTAAATSAPTVWAPETHLVRQYTAELLPDQTVDQKVHGRVERQKGIGCAVEIAQGDQVQADVGRSELHGGEGDSDQQRRQLADDEHRDDRDEHQRQILVVLRRSGGLRTLRLAGAEHLGTAPADLTQAADESHVQDDDRGERADRAENEVADRLVDDEIVAVLAERRRLGDRPRLTVVASCRVDDGSFEEARHVVDDRGDDDDDHRQFGAL